MIKIACLTSSRADFGIYLPLLKKINTDPDFELSIIAFGTHLSKFHGYTLDEIKSYGFEIKHTISSMLLNDDAVSVSTAYALTAMKFADFWADQKNKFDWVLCLGDRYEMAAAVASGIPFNIPFAHIHGGETTLGAIDNIYRHSISLASSIHFVSTAVYAQRIKELVGKDASCFVTGSLSLDNLETVELLSKEDFGEKWGIDLSFPNILVTIHPETIAFEKNEYYAQSSYEALNHLAKSYQIIITMPNADTSGTLFRKKFVELKLNFPSKVFLVENFGTQSYFTCMNYAKLMLGNTSSGIVEAASFNKYVVNIGDRQKGRLTSDNVIHVPFNTSAIIEAAKSFTGKTYNGKNIYFKGDAAEQIVSELKKTIVK